MTALFRRLSVLSSLLAALLLPCWVLAAEGQFISETVHSKALENNLLGDSPDRKVTVYLPPSYDSSPEKHYPVVYLLHGYLMDNTSWTGGFFSIRTALNSFMAEHPDREMILVMPDGHNKYLGSWYVNSPVTGNWEDFIVQELVQHIDSTYRTLPQAAHRGLAGYSMGGSGAWILTIRYPEVYGAVYSLSGGVAPHDLLKDELMWRKVLAVENMDQFDSLPNYIYQAQVSLAAAFSPNPDKPPFLVDFPYELVGDELRVVGPVWQKWLANLDLPAMMHTYQAQLRQLRGIRFGWGDQEFDIDGEHRSTMQALTEEGLPYIYDKYTGLNIGGHVVAIPYKMETYVLPFFAQVLYGHYPTVRQATGNLGSALAGQPLTADLQIELAEPLEATGTFPQMSLDLSPLGLEERPFLHDGQGRYTFDGTIVPPSNGRFRLPVHLHSEGDTPYLFFEVALDVWPAEEQTLFTDGLASGWQATTSNNVTLDPQATTQVFAGNTSLGVQASGNSFALRFLPPEPLDVFGYTLRFTFHPGEATGGSLPSFKLALRGKDVLTAVTKKLNGVNVDLEKKEWQVVEVPLQEMDPGEPARTIELSGTLKGTFYLDDIRLVPQAAPQPTAVAEERTVTLPQAFSLAQNFPNPFNSSTVIRFALPAPGEVELAVFNLAGQRVATLAQGHREAGAYAINWDGRDARGKELASGVYLYRLRAGEQLETRRLALVR